MDNKHARVVLLAIILAAIGTPAARADHGIVYSARYYLPSGSKSTSHFHLYRIDPDGRHRRQLTFGTMEDQEPNWSPDGKRVVFERDGSWPEFHPRVCVLSLGTGRVKRICSLGDWGRIRWIDDDHIDIANHWGDTIYDVRNGGMSTHQPHSDVLISPDGKHTCIVGHNGDSVIQDAKGNRVHVDRQLETWVDNSTLVGLAPDISDDGMNKPRYFVFHLNGKSAVKYFRIDRTPPANDNLGAYGDFDYAMRDPARLGYFIVIENWHNSTVGTDFGYYEADASTGAIEFLAEGQFLRWSPEAHGYCIAPGRHTTNYTRRRDGDWRTVWSAPLSVVDAVTRKSRQITPPLSWVTGADWR